VKVHPVYLLSVLGDSEHRCRTGLQFRSSPAERPIESCEGGSGTVNADVDHQWSIDPPVITLVPDWLDWFDIIPDLEIGGTTAEISGPGLAYANSLFAAPGSSAEAHA
jgi:hypothetical protein